jgi:hypothetical protein
MGSGDDLFSTFVAGRVSQGGMYLQYFTTTTGA